MSDNHIVKAPDVEIVERPADNAKTLHPLIQALIRGDIDIETVKEVEALQERHEAREAKKAYQQSMVELKADMPNIIAKDKKTDYTSKKGGRVRYSYSTLANALDQILPHLTKHGFTLSWLPEIRDGLVYVTSTLTHIGGAEKSTTLSGPPDDSGLKNPLQAIGSTQLYLERYGGLALLGVVTRDMPDADNQGTGGDVVDAAKNIEAVAFLQTEGIGLQEAEDHVGVSVRAWTADNLAQLRALVKDRRRAQTTNKTHNYPTDDNLSSIQKTLITNAKGYYGEDNAMREISRMCRQRNTSFGLATDEQCESMIREIELSADKAAIG